MKENKNLGADKRACRNVYDIRLDEEIISEC